MQCPDCHSPRVTIRQTSAGELELSCHNCGEVFHSAPPSAAEQLTDALEAAEEALKKRYPKPE